MVIMMKMTYVLEGGGVGIMGFWEHQLRKHINYSTTIKARYVVLEYTFDENDVSHL